MYLLARPELCTDLAEVWELLGWVLWFFKIAIPILIIVFGMIDLGKSVVASKPEEISKSAKSLAFRAVAGIFIFFVPTLVSMVFKVAPGFKEDIVNDAEYQVCLQCVTDPNGYTCTKAVKNAQNK